MEKEKACKPCRIKEFFNRDHTPAEKGAMVAAALLTGVAVGLLLAPVTSGTIWSCLSVRTTAAIMRAAEATTAKPQRRSGRNRRRGRGIELNIETAFAAEPGLMHCAAGLEGRFFFCFCLFISCGF